MATGGSGSVGTPDPVVWREGEPKDGGPAFPQPSVHGGPLGMSLRDWIAGQALAGFAANPAVLTVDVAKAAYKVADAMLAAREGK